MCDKPQPTKTVKPDLCAENVPIDIRVSEAAPSSLPAYLARGRTVGAEFVDDNPTAELLFEEPLPEVAAPLAREISAGCILRSRYQLQQSIGQGGDSIVFRAQDLQLAATADSADSFVAIKILLPRQRTNVHALTRLRREFQQMQCLAHPGIVRVFNFECDGDVWFMTMELVAGQSVNSWMQAPSSPAQAVKIITVCCEALEHAHSAGILHGDLKPSNVLVADDGTVKLIDFGSAPSPGTRHTLGPGPSVAATPIYASPQVLAGSRAEPRDDIFSLACLSYSILSGGKHPFGRRPSLEAGRAKSAPTYVPAIPAKVFAVIERGLSAERQRRPASAAEFLRDLMDAGLGRLAVQRTSQRAVQNEKSVATAGRSGIENRVRQACGSFRRAPNRATLIGLAVVILAAAVVFRQLIDQNLSNAPASRPAGENIALLAAASMPVQPSPSTAAESEPDVQTPPITRDPGLISFEQATLQASPGQSLVAIPVKRLQSTRGSARVAWRVEHGSAQPGVDYPRLEPQIVRFIEGQAVRSLFIPLIRTHASLTSGPRSFTVALQRVAGGAALGPIARVTVIIEPAPSAAHAEPFQARADQ